jgi:lysophospholipase L1-like esterase
MNWETILFLGDSLTVGARSYLGFPEYVGNMLSEKLSKEWNVINHATNGFRAIDLARSLSDNYANLSSNTPLLSVVLIGTNDAKSTTSIEEYTIAMEQIIIKAKLLTMNNNVLLLDIPILRAGVSYPYTAEMNKTIAKYNQVILRLTEKHQIKHLVIPMENEDYFDGVHFNKKGTIRFAEGVVDHIMKARGI